MNKKGNWMSKVGDFISGKGFYLVVLICVAAIALSGYYLVRSVRSGVEEGLGDQPVTGSAAITGTPAPTAPAWRTPSPAPTARPSQEPQSSVQPSEKPAASATVQPEPSAPASQAPAVADPQPTAPESPAPLVFTKPVNGTVIAGFSVEALAYDETMGDWRTHEGIDISADLGAQVLAVADGTVSAVYEDDLMGTVIEIEHGSALVSRYANLQAAPEVAVGDYVTTGAVIGAVGDTAAAESGRGAHLHFAMLRGGEAVNPEEFFSYEE